MERPDRFGHGGLPWVNVITDDELASVAPRKTRTIDIEAFVDLTDVDPVYFDHPYFLVPSGETEGARRAYALLVDVLATTQRAALARFVLRTKEYLAILRVRDGRLALTTMLFHDEARERKGIDTGKAHKPSRSQIDNAVALIEELSVGTRPATRTATASVCSRSEEDIPGRSKMSKDQLIAAISG